MKKLSKFLLFTLSIAAVAAGAYLLYKKFVAKKDDDSSDCACEAEDDFTKTEKADAREYVSINITSEDSDDEVDTADADTAGMQRTVTAHE